MPLTTRIFHPLWNQTITFLRTSKETEEAYTLFEVELRPSAHDCPAHARPNHVELLEVVQGELGVDVGTEDLILRVGEAVTVPAGTPCCFYPVSAEQVRFHVECRPGSTGLENSLRILFGLARDGLCDGRGLPRRLDHLAVVLALSDSHPPGLRAHLLRPFLVNLAAFARRRGVEAELMTRYCT